MLSDGRNEHILNVFGFTSHGKLTNTVERYVHRVRNDTIDLS